MHVEGNGQETIDDDNATVGPDEKGGFYSGR